MNELIRQSICHRKLIILPSSLPLRVLPAAEEGSVARAVHPPALPGDQPRHLLHPELAPSVQGEPRHEAGGGAPAGV